jgi:predicted small integral membrane protein
MTLRASKIALVFGVAVFYSIVVFNNITDYDSNFQFIRHVLMMDSTFPNNHGMWRAVNSPVVHTVFYISIIAWESITMMLCWWGALRLAMALRLSAPAFHLAKGVAVTALTFSLLMWLVAFLGVGAEWFLMWQSKSWNGQETAFRMFTVVGVVLVFLALPDREEQP